MPSKTATPKKAPASSAAKKSGSTHSSAAADHAALRKEIESMKSEVGSLRSEVGSLGRKLESSSQANAGMKEAIRRLASGTVVTEEHRDELIELLDPKE